MLNIDENQWKIKEIYEQKHPKKKKNSIILTKDIVPLKCVGWTDKGLWSWKSQVKNIGLSDDGYKLKYR